MQVMDFLSVCYHYIHDQKSVTHFPRIWGNTEEQFRTHLELFKKEYSPISLQDVRDLYTKGRAPEPQQTGLLLTFDDGLSDHYRAAKILKEYDIAGVFFIPSCIFEDHLPANPQIIHYTLAQYGITTFLSAYHSTLQQLDLSKPLYHIERRAEALQSIAAIKKMFKYTLPPELGRNILLSLYRQLLLKDSPDILTEMHLTFAQVQEMLSMGHSIGTHTRTHISIAASELSEAEFKKEIIAPRHYLEETFKTEVDSFSYPFGGKEDCLSARELLQKTSEYNLAFTVEPVRNTPHTNPLELGRCEPWPHHGASELKDMLDTMNTRV